jgi:MFS family permease
VTTDAGAGFRPAPISDAESAYAWWRLGVAVTLSTLGGVGMWSVVVALPALQSEFGVARAEASLPYTLTMLCFGGGGILIGRLVDRFGVVYPLLGAVIALGVGYVVAAETATLWQFALAQGALIGIASAATFGPLLADVSHWFTRRRGIAIAICAAGNYLAGALWPPIVQHFVTAAGWRHTYIGIGLFCVATMLPLILCLRRPGRRRKPALPGSRPRNGGDRSG